MLNLFLPSPSFLYFVKKVFFSDDVPCLQHLLLLLHFTYPHYYYHQVYSTHIKWVTCMFILKRRKISKKGSSPSLFLLLNVWKWIYTKLQNKLVIITSVQVQSKAHKLYHEHTDRENQKGITKSPHTSSSHHVSLSLSFNLSHYFIHMSKLCVKIITLHIITTLLYWKCRHAYQYSGKRVKPTQGKYQQKKRRENFFYSIRYCSPLREFTFAYSYYQDRNSDIKYILIVDLRSALW